MTIALNETFRIAALTAASAGTRAVIGHAMHVEAARVLSDLGGDGSAFAARQLTPRIAGGADLVLAMTTQHRDAVLEMAPRLLSRTFTLAEAACLATAYQPDSIGQLAALRPYLSDHKPVDIEDPIGEGPQVFRSVAVQIAELLPAILELCKRAAGCGDV
ncbi:arsenate reductase/protein-tyrosine-phosphatase family protein [Mycobacterium sp. BMJ-28]